MFQRKNKAKKCACVRQPGLLFLCDECRFKAIANAIDSLRELRSRIFNTKPVAQQTNVRSVWYDVDMLDDISD